MTIKYAAERIDVNRTQLAAWTGWISGHEMHLAGPCPACQHDSPVVSEQRVTAMEAAAGPRVLAVSLACACALPHAKRPDGAAGCGRSWSCTATADAGHQVTLTELSDPALSAAAGAFREAAATQLSGLRSAAEKWIGGVTALFGLFGVAGAVTARSTVAGLPAGWQTGIAIAGGLAVALAGLAVYWIYRAAYGWPVSRTVADNDELLDWYAARSAAPRVQARFLSWGVRAAGGALTGLAVTLGLLWFAPQVPPAVAKVQVTLTSGAQVCGSLLPAAGGVTLVRRASDGVAVGIAAGSIAALTVVSAC